jgi:hypothetical protein
VSDAQLREAVSSTTPSVPETSWNETAGRVRRDVTDVPNFGSTTLADESGDWARAAKPATRATTPMRTTLAFTDSSFRGRETASESSATRGSSLVRGSPRFGREIV